MIEQAKFTYSPLEKAQVETLKALKLEEELESIERLFPKNMRTDEIKNEIYETKKMGRNN